MIFAIIAQPYPGRYIQVIGCWSSFRDARRQATTHAAVCRGRKCYFLSVQKLSIFERQNISFSDISAWKLFIDYQICLPLWFHPSTKCLYCIIVKPNTRPFCIITTLRALSYEVQNELG